MQEAPNTDRFIGIGGVLVGVLFFTLQTDGVEMNWQFSLVIYIAVLMAVVWSLLRHAIPHLRTSVRSVSAAVIVVVISIVGFIGTKKQYLRQHPALKPSVASPAHSPALPNASPPESPYKVSKHARPPNPTSKPDPVSSLGGIPKPPPDVVKADDKVDGLLSIFLVDPTDPGIIFENDSDKLVEGLTWELVMFRVSDAAFFSYPTQNASYLKPHTRTPSYSMSLTTLPKANNGGKELREGDILIGSIALDCPLCRGTTYAVSFTWKKSGWFHKVENEHGGLLTPKGMSSEAVAKYVIAVESEVLPDERITMRMQQ